MSTIRPGLVRADRALLGLVLLLTFFLGSFVLANSDFWMHLATGRLLFHGEYQVGVDPFSYTTSDVEWINQSWLFDGLIYGLYNLVGVVGLNVLKALWVVGLALLLFRIRRPEQSLWIPTIGTGLAILVLSPQALFQPQCVSLFFLALTLSLLLRDDPPRNQQSRRLWLLPVLFLVWVNMDSWFVLGPLTLFLFWLGSLIQSWLGQTPNHPPRRLGLMLGAGLVACLLNPHHYQAFQLPPELAYPLVQAADQIGCSALLPDWLVAGGLTWKTLRENDPQFLLSLSPLSSLYRSAPSLGKNVAGLSYFPLLTLGLAGFLLPGGKALLNVPRVLLWCVFALLSLLQYRFIAFFAVVAGPIAVLTYQDYLSRRGSPLPEKSRWPVVGRAITALAVLVLLALAWPGWLHTAIGNERSPRRVAWQVRQDPSLRQALERLQELKEKNLIHNGFALHPDVAHYCAWFAPEIKNFFDRRWALFYHQAGAFVRLRQGAALLSGKAGGKARAKAGADHEDWPATARAFDINYLVVHNWGGGGGFNIVTRALARGFWLQSQRWPWLYGDGQTMIFGWNPPGDSTDAFAGEHVDLSRLAFRPVPEDESPPAHGTNLPGEEPAWRLYLFGQGAAPIEASAVDMLEGYNRARIDLRQRLWWDAWTQLAWKIQFVHSAAALAPVLPWPPLGSLPLADWITQYEHFRREQIPPGRDFGLPPVPPLMMRHARRAVAQAPASPEAYKALAHALHATHIQEDHWAADRGQSLDFRSRLRLVQVVSAWKAYLRLKPDDPEAHRTLMQIYEQLHYLDVAQEHRILFYKYLHRAGSAIPLKVSPEQLEADLKMHEDNLRQRRADFDLQAHGRSPADQVNLALGKFNYRFTGPKGKERIDPNGLGLAYRALAVLKETQSDPKLARDSLVRQWDLQCMLGQLDEVGEALAIPELKKLGFGYYQIQALWAAARGDYELTDSALTEMGKQLVAPRAYSLLLYNLTLRQPAIFPLLTRTGLLFHPFLQIHQREYMLATHQSAQFALVRGLMALEMGDPARAERLFKESLELQGGAPFMFDTPIAVRYWTLLKAQER
jgi:hypothetical protein